MADSPPSTRRGTARTRARAAAAAEASSPPRKGSLEGRLQEFFSIFALGFSAVGDEHCANVVTRGTPDLARAWAKLADESPAVKRTLERLMTGGAWGGVVISTLAIAIPIAQHHNALPDGFINPFAVATVASENNGNGSSHPTNQPPARDPLRPDSPPPRATA